MVRRVKVSLFPLIWRQVLCDTGSADHQSLAPILPLDERYGKKLSASSPDKLYDFVSRYCYSAHTRVPLVGWFFLTRVVLLYRSISDCQ